MNIPSLPMAMADTLLSNLSVGILVYEGDNGNCVLANRAVADMLGGSGEELRQQNFQTLASRCQLAESTLNDRLSGHHEVTLQPVFGRIITLDCFISRFDFEGKPHLLCTFTDITESKRTQEKLEKERALLRCLIDSASDLIFIKDQDSVYRACNKASEAFIGMPESEQIGKTDYDFFEREKAEVIQKADRQVLDEGKPVHIEEWVTSRHGRRLLMDTVKTPYYDPDGKPLGLVGIGRDLTERKLLEQERLAHLRFFENMDRVNRAIQGADDLQKMMKDLLDVVLSIFDCDRSYLMYPCDPDSSTWSVPMESNKPGNPGAHDLKIEMEMDPQVAETLRILLAADGPVKFGPGTEHELPEDVSKQFGIQSFMAMAVYPKTGSPWQFGIHQCACARTWTEEEERLFREIGRRLADGLSTMLSHRDLRRSLEKLEQAQRLAHIGSWELDLMDKVQIWSNELFRILEINPENVDASYDVFLERVHPDDREAVDSAYTTALETKAPFAISYRLLLPDRRIKYIRGQSEIYHEGGKPIRFIGTVQDITEHALAEKALRESERKLGEAARIANVGYWERDLIAETITLSEEACRIFGLAWPSPFSNISEWHEQWLKLIHPEDRSRAARSASVAQAGGPPYDVNYRVVRSDGDVRDIHSYAEVTRDASGKPLRMFGTMIDITERKAAEKEIKLLSYALDHIREGAFLVDLRNRIVYVNQEASRSLGYEGDELLGLSVSDINPDYTMERLTEVIGGAQDESVTFESRHRTRSGHIFPVEITATRIEYGGTMYGLALVRNITQRKRAEEEIRKLNQELEQRVADRTAQLQAANKELEAFAYSASHDLRAPLRHIDGFLELLQKKVKAMLDKQGRHYMDNISNAARKMNQLIDNLLSFSRTGRQAMSFQQVELERLVHDVIRELKPDTAGMAIEWRIGALPSVGGDVSMLRIVLTNLIANALKFTRPRPQARIEISSLPGQDAETVIFVRDNGVGFDMTHADKLFGVFQRLHRADEFEGTGIGLANVRRIIARHGGRTWAEGAPDQGATFYFALPHMLHGGGDERP